METGVGVVNRSPRRSSQAQVDHNDFRVNKGRSKAHYYACGVIGLVVAALNIYYLFPKTGRREQIPLNTKLERTNSIEFNSTGYVIY